MRDSNLIGGILTFAIAIAFIVESLRLPTFETFYVSPGFFPLIVAVLLLIPSVGLLLQYFLSSHKQKAPKESNRIDKKGAVNMAVILGGMLGYVILLFAGLSYPVATFIFLLCTMFYFAPKYKIRNVFLSILCAGGLYYIFSDLFMIPLP